MVTPLKDARLSLRAKVELSSHATCTLEEFRTALTRCVNTLCNLDDLTLLNEGGTITYDQFVISLKVIKDIPEYDDCAEAERDMKETLTWENKPTYYSGHNSFGLMVCKVPRRFTD